MANKTSNDAPIYDIALVGIGLVGSTLALSLVQALPHLRLYLCGARRVGFADHGSDKTANTISDNALALAPDTVALLQKLNVWPALHDEATPVRAMTLSEGNIGDDVFPSLLDFAPQAGGKPLAHIVFASVLGKALQEKVAGVVKQAKNFTVSTAMLSTITEAVSAHQLTFNDGTNIKARLVIAADGAHSYLRQHFDLGWHGFAYDQLALTGVISHTAPHYHIARQHFFKGGPFALLPLKGNHSFVVWSEEKSHASFILQQDVQAQQEALQQQAGFALGDVSLTAPLTVHPLQLRLARHIIAHRLALVGDAAHVVHPLAGQGLNLGIRDGAALIKALIEAHENGLDLGSAIVLENYQKTQRHKIASAAFAFDAINRTTRVQSSVFSALRNISMGLVNHTPKLKAALMRAAAGG